MNELIKELVKELNEAPSYATISKELREFLELFSQAIEKGGERKIKREVL